jgi:hypothetical protein
MKTLAVVTRITLVALALGGAVGTAFAMDDEQAKLECFRLHHGLMDKPAVQNVDACWRAHGYQMQK